MKIKGSLFLKKTVLVFLVFSFFLGLNFKENQGLIPEKKILGHTEVMSLIPIIVEDTPTTLTVNNSLLIFEFSKEKDKYNQVYDFNETLLIKDDFWMLQGSDLKEDSTPIQRLDYEIKNDFQIIVKDYYEDAKKNNSYYVEYYFFSNRIIKLLVNVTSLGFLDNYTIRWRCNLFTDNILLEETVLKFYDSPDNALIFDYSDVFRDFGNITDADISGWFKGKRFDLTFNVGPIEEGFLLDPSLGLESVGGSNYPVFVDATHGRTLGCVFTATENGTVTDLYMYTWLQTGGSVSVTSTGVIYSITDGYIPTDLLATSSNNASAINDTARWCSWNFSTTYDIIAGNKYFFGVNMIPNASSNWWVSYDAGDINQTVLSNYDNPPPETPFDVNTYQDYKLSLYVVYTLPPNNIPVNDFILISDMDQTDNIFSGEFYSLEYGGYDNDGYLDIDYVLINFTQDLTIRLCIQYLNSSDSFSILEGGDLFSLGSSSSVRSGNILNLTISVYVEYEILEENDLEIKCEIWDDEPSSDIDTMQNDYFDLRKRWGIPLHILFMFILLILVFLLVFTRRIE